MGFVQVLREETCCFLLLLWLNIDWTIADKGGNDNGQFLYPKICVMAVSMVQGSIPPQRGTRIASPQTPPNHGEISQPDLQVP